MRYGYTVQAPNADEHNVYYARSLHTEIQPPVPLQGIVIRKLQGNGEMEAYQDLFGFSGINSHHLHELLESQEYCHWVMEDPRGGFVAYCECSICSMEWELSGDRIGWIDYIETKPDHQKKGFGQAILLAGLHQLQELGADTAMLVTINTNTPAIRLYKKTGFHEVVNLEKPGYIKNIFTPSS
jgi:ribosomal protein S18 acetylase RimI-like enzyme